MENAPGHMVQHPCSKAKAIWTGLVRVALFLNSHCANVRIYQYSNMDPRLSGQNCKSLKFVLSLNSQKRLGYKENNTKYRRLSRKPRSHVRMLIHRTWPIASEQADFFYHLTGSCKASRRIYASVIYNFARGDITLDSNASDRLKHLKGFWSSEIGDIFGPLGVMFEEKLDLKNCSGGKSANELIHNSGIPISRTLSFPNLPITRTKSLKAMVNEDALLWTHYYSCFLGTQTRGTQIECCVSMLRKLGNICCGHEMFLTKSETFLVSRT